MKILHLEASSGWGGQEMRILREAEGMRARGHELIFAVMKEGKLIGNACKAGFTVYPLNFHKLYWPICLFQLLSMIRKHQIDLVNTHSSLDSWIGGIASRISGVPIVRTRHLSTPIKPGWNSRILYGKLADFVVTTCASIVPMISAQSGKPQSSCRSIPTGVDPKKICSSDGESKKFRTELGVGQDEFLVGTACFLRSWKGINDLLKAADLLREESGIKWVIIGGGHEKAYRDRAKELKLDGIVHFTGHLENPFPALGSLDVFTLLSTAHEGVSQAMLQAAYLKRPLLSTRTGGLGEVCLDGITGIQVEPFSPYEIVKAVLKLRKVPSLREQMGQNGRDLVEEKFTFEKTLSEMERVYDRVLVARK